MKKYAYIFIAIILSVGTTLASGGKNHGESGSGETSTGSDAQGEAEQDRSGRDDASIFFFTPDAD